MKEKGWRPFWAALLAALLVLLPLVGGTVLLTRRSLRTRLASRPQSGVAIRQPKEENRLSLLVCIAPTETTAPGFLLLYLNASQNCIHALALPGELTVPFGADEASLADCYRAAGPARCREALLSALSLPEDTHYLALAPSVLQAIADRYGMLRVGFSGALTAEELALTGCSSNVQAISAREAEELLNGMEDTVPPAHKAAARAAVWDAFFRQELELLPAALPVGVIYDEKSKPPARKSGQEAFPYSIRATAASCAPANHDQRGRARKDDRRQQCRTPRVARGRRVRRRHVRRRRGL